MVQIFNYKRGNTPKISGTVPAKVFLAAYTIVKEPVRAMGDVNAPWAKEVVDSAKTFIEAIHEVSLPFF